MRLMCNGRNRVRLIDFDDPDANDWVAVNKFTVIEGSTQSPAGLDCPSKRSCYASLTRRYRAKVLASLPIKLSFGQQCGGKPPFPTLRSVKGLAQLSA